MFNKDNIEQVAQVKQGQVECLGSLFGIPKFSEDSSLKFQPCEMLAKQVLKPLKLYF